MADNVHWLRDTYGPALRAFYADLLKQPVPQRFADLIASLEAEAASAAAARPPQEASAHPATAQPHVSQPDTPD
jgi:hypothetical protein